MRYELKLRYQKIKFSKPKNIRYYKVFNPKIQVIVFALFLYEMPFGT